MTATIMPPSARAAQDKMARDMRMQSLGAPLFALINEIYQAVELPPDLERRVLAVNEFVKGRPE